MVLVQKKDPEVRRACPFEGKEAPTEGVKSFSLPLLCRERAPHLAKTPSLSQTITTYKWVIYL